MDDFLILLQAKLDEAKSKGNVNAGIDKLQNQLDKLKVQVELDPKAAQKLADNIGKLINQKIVISNIGIDTKSGIKAGQDYGKQFSQGISQGMSSASKSTEKMLRDFSELNDAKRKFVDGHDLISKDDIADAEKLYDTVRKAFSEFGQVTVSKGSMNDGSLENMRVKIEQVNGEMKITRDFMLYFNENKNGFRLVDDDTIRTTEKMIQHLNEEKNIVNATNEEANAIKAKLADQEKYYKNIKNEVNNLYSLKTKLLSADELQTAELEKQIKQTKERISYNNKQIDKKDLRDSSLDRQINDLEVIKQKQLNLARAKSQDTVNTKELAQAEREATAALKERQSIEAQVNKIQLSFSSLIAEWKKQGILSDQLSNKISQIQTKLTNLSTQGDMSAFKTNLQTVQAEVNQLTKELSVLSNFKLNILPQVQDNMANGLYTDQVQQQIEKYNRLGLELPNVQSRINELKNAENELNSVMSNGNSTVEQQRIAYEKFQSALKTTNQTNSLASSMYMSQDAVDGLIVKLQTFLKNNSGMTIRAKAEIQGWISKIQQAGVVYKSMGNDAVTAMKKIEAKQRSINKLGLSRIDTIRNGMKTFSYWTSSTFLAMKGIQSFKNAISSVTALDTASVDLKKTTTMTASQLEDFYYASNDVAKQMGVTTEEIINQASAWSRLGYSSDEAATKMAKYSSMFASISPGMDVDTATDGLVSIMKAFDIGNDNPDDVLDGIMSKINIIGNTAATSNAEIVNMLSKSSSAMKEANNTLEETVALETAAVEISRDDDSVGTAFKTKFYCLYVQKCA